MLWMKKRRGKSWHRLYKETLLKVEEVNRHLRTLQQKYEGAKEEIINLEQAIADIHLRHKQHMDAERTEQTKAILLMRLKHEDQLNEIKVEFTALQIDLERIKVKDDIAHTTEALIAQCVRILGEYMRGRKPGDKEGAVIGTALDEIKSSYQRDQALRRQASENAVRRVGHPHTATDMNRAMYGLGGSPLGNVHISEMGKWPEAGMSTDKPTGDPGNKVGIGEVPKVDIHIREDEPEQKSGPSQRPPNSTKPDSKGT